MIRKSRVLSVAAIIVALALLTWHFSITRERPKPDLKGVTGFTIVQDRLFFAVSGQGVSARDKDPASVQIVSLDGRLQKKFLLPKSAFPTGIAVTGQTIFISDSMKNRVLKYDFNGKLLKQFGGFQADTVKRLGDITVDEYGNAYVIEELTHRAVKIDGNGNRVLAFGGAGPGTLRDPRLIVADNSRNTIYIANHYLGADHRVIKADELVKFSFDGRFLGKVRLAGAKAPISLALAGSGDILIADYLAFMVRKFSPSGKPILQFGRPNKNGGPGQFGAPPDEYGPTDVAVDSRGNIYVFDGVNDRLQVFKPSGQYIETW